MQNGVTLTEHDLAERPLSDEEILALVTKAPGEMRGPIVVFDDGATVMGFNRDRLEELAGKGTERDVFPMAGAGKCSL